jgi:hypothetical protein
MKTFYFLKIAVSLLFLTHAGFTAFAFKIDSLKIDYDKNQLVLPGEKFSLSITSFHADGKIRKTRGVPGGNVSWGRYNVFVAGGRFANGKIEVNEKLVPSVSKYIEVEVSPKKNPEIQERILIPLNFETSVEFIAEMPFAKSPGSVIEGKIISVYNNGVIRISDKLRTESESAGFYFETSGGRWQKGKFIVDPDFLNIENHTASLVVTPVLSPAISDTFSVLLDYKQHYTLNFNASAGSWGSSGGTGSSGGSGCDGGNGGFGQDGEPGENAPDIGVWADLYFDSLLNCNLLYVYTLDFWSGGERFLLVNPDNGSVAINANGGSGGNGGNGGRGGDGGNGRDGEVWFETVVIEKLEKQPQSRTVIKKEKKQVTDAEGNTTEIEVDVVTTETVYVDVVVQENVTIRHEGPGENGGNGGHGGGGGFGGPGGDGGYVYFYFTDDAAQFEYLFTANTRGGSGGMNGSAGNGGSGGTGGLGNPSGNRGASGGYGPSAFGISGSEGRNGIILKDKTDEFFFYQTADVENISAIQTKKEE